MPYEIPIKKTQLSMVKPAKDLISALLVKGLLVSPTGGGKTTAALTLPGKKLVVDTDHRLGGVTADDVVVLQYSPDTVNPTKPWSDILELKTELWAAANKGEFPYDAVIFDGISTLSALAMYWSLGLTTKVGAEMKTLPGGGPGEAHYGPQIHQMTTFIASIIPLPCHVIFTGHVDLYEDKHTGRVEYHPTLYGKTARSIVPSMFNETYRCFKKKDIDGKLKFYLDTAGDGQRYDFLKSSFNKPVGSLWTDPFHVDLLEKEPGFQKILRLVRESKGMV